MPVQPMDQRCGCQKRPRRLSSRQIRWWRNRAIHHGRDGGSKTDLSLTCCIACSIGSTGIILAESFTSRSPNFAARLHHTNAASKLTRQQDDHSDAISHTPSDTDPNPSFSFRYRPVFCRLSFLHIVVQQKANSQTTKVDGDAIHNKTSLALMLRSKAMISRLAFQSMSVDVAHLWHRPIPLTPWQFWLGVENEC